MKADLILQDTTLNDQECSPTNDSGNVAANDDDNEDDDGVVAGPTVEARVDLGKRPCE